MSDTTPATYDDDILKIVDMYSDTALQIQNKMGMEASSAAVLGAILEEYNDRFETVPSFAFQLLGQFASYVLNRNHGGIRDDHDLVKAGTPEWRATIRRFKKLVYPVKIDVGLGNVQLYTAIERLNEYNDKYPDSDPLNIKKYNSNYAKLERDLSEPFNTSTVKFASLMIEKGMAWGAKNISNWNSLDALDKEAFAVYFYNVGEEYVNKLRDNAIKEKGIYNADIDRTDIAQEYLNNYSAIVERMLPDNERLSGLRKLIADGWFDEGNSRTGEGTEFPERGRTRNTFEEWPREGRANVFVPSDGVERGNAVSREPVQPEPLVIPRSTFNLFSDLTAMTTAAMVRDQWESPLAYDDLTDGEAHGAPADSARHVATRFEPRANLDPRDMANDSAIPVPETRPDLPGGL